MASPLLKNIPFGFIILTILTSWSTGTAADSAEHQFDIPDVQDDPNPPVFAEEDFDDNQNPGDHYYEVTDVENSEAKSSICTLSFGNPKISGTIIFEQPSLNDLVKISGEIKGLDPLSTHGFHIHQTGDMRKSCDSTGPHFNPSNVSHGGPKDSIRHVGDLGNIIADSSGIAKLNMTDNMISLQGENLNNIIGRAIVIHADADDLGKGSSPLSKTTGNAGARIACGLIGVL